MTCMSKGCGEDCVECAVADELFKDGDIDADKEFSCRYPKGWPSWLKDAGVCC